ncbi:MAG: hypothetical protein MZW92_30615 [Comamonadaceae bacterium]|nr:hypothetical protein [Comamonadaceae bacterium]
MGKPDRMIFDLDPGEGVDFAAVREGALLVKTLLDELGLASWLKTSGGKGLHVVVPLTLRDDYDTVKAFSRAFVEHLGGDASRALRRQERRRQPRRPDLRRLPAQRRGRRPPARSAGAPGPGGVDPGGLGRTPRPPERRRDAGDARASVVRTRGPLGCVLDDAPDADVGDEAAGQARRAAAAPAAEDRRARRSARSRHAHQRRGWWCDRQRAGLFLQRPRIADDFSAFGDRDTGSTSPEPSMINAIHIRPFRFRRAWLSAQPVVVFHGGGEPGHPPARPPSRRRAAIQAGRAARLGVRRRPRRPGADAVAGLPRAARHADAGRRAAAGRARPAGPVRRRRAAALRRDQAHHPRRAARGGADRLVRHLRHHGAGFGAAGLLRARPRGAPCRDAAADARRGAAEGPWRRRRPGPVAGARRRRDGARARRDRPAGHRALRLRRRGQPARPDDAVGRPGARGGLARCCRFRW